LSIWILFKQRSPLMTRILVISLVVVGLSAANCFAVFKWYTSGIPYLCVGHTVL
jgi:hypothetical protein